VALAEEARNARTLCSALLLHLRVPRLPWPGSPEGIALDPLEQLSARHLQLASLNRSEIG
jgi:hypothetical protein